jgi:uncharacterized hydrophobic protein (TIGR00271 family)
MTNPVTGASLPPDAVTPPPAAALDEMFPEGPAFRRSQVTYAVLLTLAALVASFGLYQNSDASIIGAMVIAPLGGAILAIAAAVATGRLRWQRISIVQVLLSALWVIAIGFVVAMLMPDPLVLTPSLDARTAPGLLDLGVALAAGAAGAYVAANRSGNDALPGVAIAVSLVPPLATAGICLKLGRLDDAAGALLLFGTNLVAIILVALIVFVILGAASVRATEKGRLRAGLAIATVALIVIALPLGWRAFENVTSVVDTQRAAPVVRAWLSEQDLTVSSYEVTGEAMRLTVTGSTAPSNVPVLATALAGAVGHPVALTVEYVPLLRIEATGG